MVKKIFLKKNKNSFIRQDFLKKNSGGFTVIETMISITIFLVVVTAGISSLLNANIVHQKSQDMRSIMDNLSFIMEDMSKNIRTGSNIRCINDNVFSISGLSTPKSCSNGGAIAFENAYGDGNINTDQWVYKVESADGGVTFNIFKSVDSAVTWTQLNPNEVVLRSFSGFSVLGAEPPVGNSQQPFVIIKLIGTITSKGISTPFSLQTSVSQRLVDN